jgi:branched-chain amino acid transport system permease protein
MLGLLLCIGFVWSIRQSPLYPVLLSIRDAERFAEAAGVRTSLIKIGVFGVSAAMAGGAGWLFSFLGVVSPGQFDWSVSLNILVMVLIGGINTTLGPVIGAAFVSMFPALVNINPWLQEMAYGALSILAVTLLPGGVMSLLKRVSAFGEGAAPEPAIAAVDRTEAPVEASVFRKFASRSAGAAQAAGPEPEYAVECRGVQFTYGTGLMVLRDVDLAVRRGDIHGLIGPNGSGKSTLANVIAGRLQPLSGATLIKGVCVDGASPSKRAKLGMRRTFQAAELVRELTPIQNVMVGLFTLKPRIIPRAPFWPFLPSGRRDLAWMEGRSREALEMVGAGAWVGRAVGDVPHGVEQLTQLASVCVAGPDIIVLDEPATGLSAREVDHLAGILSELKAQGVTMIIIEHQTRFLFPLCDRVTVLNAGEVILTGTADEVRAHPVVRQVYLGE